MTIFTFFACQQARILNKLYPLPTNPPAHAHGPRKPDMIEQEAILVKAPISDE